MTVETVQLKSALVFRDADRPWRWFDAFGPGVVKHSEDGVRFPNDDTTGDPVEWECTITEAGAGDSTIVTTDVAGGALLIQTAGNDDDGYQMQLGMAAGENVTLAGSQYLYLGVTFAISDVTQSDFLCGVCVTDTDCLGAVTDGMYFRKVDGSTLLYFVTEKNSVEGATAVATLANAGYTTAEFYFDGSTVSSYINGVFASSTARGDATFPNDELLRLTVEFLTGEVAVKTCTITDLRMIHII
jgi:hypothetical protein